MTSRFAFRMKQKERDLRVLIDKLMDEVRGTDHGGIVDADVRQQKNHCEKADEWNIPLLLSSYCLQCKAVFPTKTCAVRFCV